MTIHGVAEGEDHPNQPSLLSSLTLALMAFAGLLEALQGLTPDRVPDLPTAFSGAAGVLSAALVASSWPNRAKLTLARPRQI